MPRLAAIERIGRYLAATPLFALALAATLLAASLGVGLHSEHVRRQETIAAQAVKAHILASSVAAALAFDDRETTREYVDALRVDPQILAAGAYDSTGRLVFGFDRSGAALPQSSRPAPPAIHDRELVVTAPVVQRGARLGSVFLSAPLEPLAHRAGRYLGIATVVVMASLLVAVLGASYATVSEAHRRLQRETESRRQAEEALRQSQKMEAMGQLTGGVAHDFNNLLMVASGGLDLLERTDDPARRERLKAGIRQAIERGTKLTQQLLAFARRSPLKPEVIDLAERIGGLHNLLERSLREDVAVELRLPAGLWPIEADASQFEVAVLNIAVNARDAMPNGGTILVSGENVPADGEAPDRVRLSIRDEGVGMAPEVIAKVFEPFFTTKGVGHGTGLGLSQVYGFAHASGGTVAIDSQLGVGTSVSLILPRSTRPVPAAAADTTDPVTTGRGGRLLVVEDDDEVAKLVCAMARECGHSVERVASAEQAIARLEGGGAADMLLSDMVMPGMGGIELARIARQRWPALPIVLMTGYSAAASAASEEGFPLLLKPYTLASLGQALARAAKAG